MGLTVGLADGNAEGLAAGCPAVGGLSIVPHSVGGSGLIPVKVSTMYQPFFLLLSMLSQMTTPFPPVTKR